MSFCKKASLTGWKEKRVSLEIAQSWHSDGWGHPCARAKREGEGFVASRQRSAFNHFSTESFGAYRIGSDNLISLSVLPPTGADATVLASALVGFPSRSTVVPVSSEIVFEALPRYPLDCSRSC